MFRGLVTAIRTLTSLPAPGRETDRPASALPWFPIVGMFVGLLLYGMHSLAVEVLGIDWAGGTAAAILLLGIGLTRALHLDGLSDWADGFWGAREKDKVLAIMKDSRTGTFGAVAIVFVLLAKWIALAKLVEAGAPEWIIAACIVSRTMQVELAVANPYARAGGGTAAAFVNGAKTFHFIAALVSAAILLFGVCGPRWMWLALVPSWFAARALGISSRRRIGGVTGDILGAANEIVELLVLGVGATLAAIGGAGRA